MVDSHGDVISGSVTAAASDGISDVEVVELRAGALQAAVVPALGGRVISMTHRGMPLLWHNDELLDDELRPRVARVDPGSLDGFATWQNWGGDKSWVAPQGWDDDSQWHGPPDATFDGGAFEATSRSDHSIVMRSAFDEITGLRMTRAITLTRECMHVTTTIRNESSRARRWAAWEVAQLPIYDADLDSPHAGIYVGMRPNHKAIHLLRLRGSLSPSTAGGLIRVPFTRAVGKLGFPGCTGAMEVRHAEAPGLRLTFRAHPQEPYPDESPGQAWMQTPLDEPLDELGGLASTAQLVELEATSPLKRLEPGATVALTCDWTPVPACVSAITTLPEGGV